MIKCFYNNKIKPFDGRYRDNLYISFDYYLCRICNIIHNNKYKYCCESCRIYSKKIYIYDNYWSKDYKCEICGKSFRMESNSEYYTYSFCHYCVIPMKNKYMNVNVL